METKKKWNWTVVLCLVLLGVNLWQGKRLENLEQRISEAQMKLSAEIGGLESSFYAQAQEEDKLVWNWEYAPSLNIEKRRLDVEVSAILKEWREDTAVELFWFVENGGSEGDSISLSGGGTGTFTGTLELPLDNTGMDIVLYAVITNGETQRRESLGLLGSMWELLPVRCFGWGAGGADYTRDANKNGVLSLHVCEAELTGFEGRTDLPQLSDQVFRLRRNEKIASEKTAVSGDRIGQYTCEELSAEAQVGDQFALTFFCRDDSGLGYEFFLEGWSIEENGLGREIAPETDYPRLTWD